MAEVVDAPAETLDRGRDRQPELRESPGDGSSSPPPPPPRRRDRDLRERRDNWPPSRRDDPHDPRNRSPPLPPPPPPPPGPPRDDKDREYRRRSSPSPPTYRDRRHSPPLRSPPPGPFMRARRDDGGYDRRRGSREVVMDRMTEDWPDIGYSNSGDSPEVIQRRGLMSYKQFIQELEDDILPAEAERRYEEYSSEYISTQKQAYFEAHKEEQWLKDKYHPTNLVAVIERRKEQAISVAKEFLLDLQSGTLDLGPGVTVSSASKSGNGSELNSEDEADTNGKRRRHNKGPTKENDLLSAAPKAHPVTKDKIDAAATEALDPFVRKIRDEKYGWKYGCGAKGCTKLFHAPEYVHKHLRLKHPDLVIELTSKVREDLYFQTYMNDHIAPGGTHVMQQSALKVKMQSRRPLLDNRLRDERGNCRDLARNQRDD
ncbi:hypothetical protein OPV22_022032 [Ensete ventricosum]|uniref:C2H2-type domain-containing protein n=1 Tax=Ensete ventricosum TaxID=4639 RepID=A0AAV8QKB8_ENSVE|nr:hypothetical protein OPV22_022032 [Ensete ventricosum]